MNLLILDGIGTICDYNIPQFKKVLPWDEQFLQPEEKKLGTCPSFLLIFLQYCLKMILFCPFNAKTTKRLDPRKLLYT